MIYHVIFDFRNISIIRRLINIRNIVLVKVENCILKFLIFRSENSGAKKSKNDLRKNSNTLLIQLDNITNHVIKKPMRPKNNHIGGELNYEI